jgi:hypothetical protein
MIAAAYCLSLHRILALRRLPAMEADRKRHRAKECKQICLQIKSQEGENFNIFYVFCVIGTEAPFLIIASGNAAATDLSAARLRLPNHKKYIFAF